jgi:hypothetical protein
MISVEFDAATRDKIALLTNMTGVIKKKREKGMVSMFSSSVERWFCFRSNGRFFVNFHSDSKPVCLDHPRKRMRDPRVSLLSQILKKLRITLKAKRHIFGLWSKEEKVSI